MLIIDGIWNSQVGAGKCSLPETPSMASGWKLKDPSDVKLIWLSLSLPRNNGCMIFDEPGVEREGPENSWERLKTASVVPLFWGGCPAPGWAPLCIAEVWSITQTRPKGIRRHKIQSAQEWKQGWACTPCSLLLNITWRNRRKAVHNIMLVEDLCATPFLQSRWKCSENLSKSQEFLWGISQQNLSKCTPQSERGPAGLKRLLIGYSKLRLSGWTSQLFRLGLFRIKCSLKSEQGNKRGPRLPEVDQTYVVKAKRDTQARSLIRHEAVIYFRFFERIFNHIIRIIN